MPPVPERFAAQFLPGVELTDDQLAELERIGQLLDDADARDHGVPVAALNRFLSDPALRKIVVTMPQTCIMRGLLDRALAALNGKLHGQFDYAYRTEQLIREWMRLLPQDDLPERFQTAEVRNHIDMRKLVRALLRRLDRIEAKKSDPKGIAQATAPQQAQTPSGESAEPKSKTAATTPRKKGTVNQRMLDEMTKNPESLFWSIPEWMKHLKCKAKSSVGESAAWKKCNAARTLERYERQEKRGEGKRRRKKRTDND